MFDYILRQLDSQFPENLCTKTVKHFSKKIKRKKKRRKNKIEGEDNINSIAFECHSPSYQAKCVHGKQLSKLILLISFSFIAVFVAQCFPCSISSRSSSFLLFLFLLVLLLTSKQTYRRQTTNIK